MKIFRVSNDDKVCYDNIVAESKETAIEIVKGIQAENLKQTEERFKNEKDIFGKNLKTIEEFNGRPTKDKDGKEIPVDVKSIEKQKIEMTEANSKRYKSIEEECEKLLKVFGIEAEKLHYFVEAESA